ncbi:S-formylglutathione hydrolase [Dasania sp. GY-MA-18]|uniref:S-formylglutathione hydrolase n=1 Tax=Dasania phycosphaerae TaxID=2950436 RepID=A0A9J6RN24_9GAMM|nr:MULTISPECIES: S-formylglutathione hydrolase [Dasania]MCR8923281.1 S-formylglutathione hydrolase [Dasania sp. GY-MA-18]MCZ0865713.1 S-formylglutathione hydrolase [Dasania phycosphaerae]MCZ0869438.1 S-formylglutathione hydrolase [Dasania phycosphaerae]
MSLEKVSENKCFAGRQLRYSHQSAVLNCSMNFSIYLPAEAGSHKVPVLYWLSGLTCTDENFVTKAGAQQFAAQHGVAIVAPDTSPRGEGVPDDADAAYDFGLGAGFYVDATQAPWSQHYHMYSYICQELPELINANFPVDGQRSSIFGHSMGGHGALTIALKNTDKYQSVSAFAPIASAMQCPWGEKALSNYIGTNKEDWRQYDATELVAKAERQIPMLVDQGTADNFLVEQLKPVLLQQACDAAGYPATIRMQEGYDHSYFFMSSFMADHIAFHAKYLK